LAHEFKHPKYYRKITMPIEKPLYASEPDEFEVIDLPSLLEGFSEWEKENPGGTFKQYIDEKPVKLSGGGSVEKYGDLIDAYIKKIDVIEGETLTEYVSRIREAEKKANE
tara:strand:+ start:73 stop:402 length:330 start_codon:yes stop_codon:yes gene_type:complete